jgi:hypothetical protein
MPVMLAGEPPRQRDRARLRVDSHQVEIEQRMDIPAEEQAVPDVVRRGSVIRTNMRGFERPGRVAARDHATVGVDVHQVLAEACLPLAPEDLSLHAQTFINIVQRRRLGAPLILRLPTTRRQ